jgi:hypothetical protein
MAFIVRESVRNPDQIEFKLLYECIDRLVNDAGHITIYDLFTKSPDEIDSRARQAIMAAKSFGFLHLNNESCCKSGDCVQSERGWCNKGSTGKCTVASDVC